MTEDVRDNVASDATNASPDASTTPLPEPTPEEAATPNPEGAAAGEEAPAPAPVASDPRPEAVDYKDRWLRTEADLQNVRRRSAREREEAVQRAEDSVLLDVIGLLDDLAARRAPQPAHTRRLPGNAG